MQAGNENEICFQKVLQLASKLQAGFIAGTMTFPKGVLHFHYHQAYIIPS